MRTKRIICIIICLLAMGIAHPLVQPVNAASSPVTVLDGDITFSFSNSGWVQSGWSGSAKTNTGSATVSGDNQIEYTNSISGFCTEMQYTFTIANTSGSKADISFSWSRSNFDSFTLEGNTGTSGTVTETLEAGESITFSPTSKCSSSQTDKLTLSGFTVTPLSDVDVTLFYDSTKGSVTAGNSAAANGDTVTAANGSLAVVATPASGCSFLGWVNMDTREVLSSAASTTLDVPENTNVEAVFINSTSAPWFGIGPYTSNDTRVQSGTVLGFPVYYDYTYYSSSAAYLYDNLNDANTYAQELGYKTIILMNSGTLPAGDYEVSSGVTLLIPFDSGNTIYTTNPMCKGETMTTPTAFRTLTMANGASIAVKGSMCVSGQYTFTNAGGQSGSPTGPLGFVNMESGSSITVDGALYAYGYIIGDGTITANSGASIFTSI